MGSSSSKNAPVGNATPQPGSTPPPAAPPIDTAGFPGAPTFQGFAGQPFNENNAVFPSFLPGDPHASATGLDREMLNAIMGISPHGTGYVAKGAADPNAPAATAAPAGMAVPQHLGLPDFPHNVPPIQSGMYADIVNGYNANIGKLSPEQQLTGYLDVRDQLAKVMSRDWSYNGGGGGNGARGVGGSSPSSSAGMGGISSGGLY